MGPIPDTLQNASRLVNLDLSSNVLTGTIPAGLGAVPNLMNLVLRTNRLTGVRRSASCLDALGDVMHKQIDYERLDSSPCPGGHLCHGLSMCSSVECSSERASGNSLSGLHLSWNLPATFILQLCLHAVGCVLH